MKRLTEVEVAQRLDISTRTLQQWRRAGIGPAFIRIGQNTIRYRSEDVDAYEQSKIEGGFIALEPEGWRSSMKRAASFLETIAKWKISADAKDRILAMSAELKRLLEKQP